MQRLLAHVFAAVQRAGQNHVAAVETTSRGVRVRFPEGPFTYNHVCALGTRLDFAGISWQRTGHGSIEVVLSEQDAAVIAGTPSIEGIARALDVALKIRITAAGFRDLFRVQGTKQRDGSEIYVTGGEDTGEAGINARATAFCAAWIAKHFPELHVCGAVDPVTKQAVAWVNREAARRFLKVTQRAAERAA